MPPKNKTTETKNVSNISNEEFIKLKEKWLDITNKIVDLESKIATFKNERDAIVIKIIDYNTITPHNLVKLTNTKLENNKENKLSSESDESDIESISDSDSDSESVSSDSE
jgi:hypothetical protein